MADDMQSGSDRDAIDRKLGDEWSEWAGDLSKYEKQINEGKALFLTYYFAALFAVTAVSMAVYYMISPRLYGFSPALDAVVMWAVAGVFTAVFVWSLMLFITVVTGRNIMLAFKSEGLHVEWLYPAVFKIAAVFGISRDRVGNSLVKVNNALIFATKKRFSASNLLVLLPRCLDPEMRLKVAEVTKKYSCRVFTATGGSSARQMVKKIRPDAIIVVAFERDLVAGMSDSPKVIPIIAITNIRPHGPCKDTVIDVDELENAIRFLVKN
jgi:hypothetical protein